MAFTPRPCVTLDRPPFLHLLFCCDSPRVMAASWAPRGQSIALDTADSQSEVVGGILVLEDDVDLRELLAMAFASVGSDTVLTAGSVGELQALGTSILHCANAVLDVNLGPGQPSGIDAARWLRSSGFHGGLVFLTGHATAFPGLRNACKELDAQLYEKPVPFERLAAIVQESHR
jgi:DNA-binding NtrC family response regulator